MTSSTSVKQSDRRNNDHNEKYSLRQRHKRSTVRIKLAKFDSDAKACCKDSPTLLSLSPFNDKFELSATTVEVCSGATSTPSTKFKAKAPPLSKYRRKTANARERTRMKEINCAFEVLRKCVPQAVNGSGHNNQSNEKLTKITTLRLAMTYISMLSNALEDNSPFDLSPRLIDQEHIFEETDVHSYFKEENYHLPVASTIRKVNGMKNVKTESKKLKKRQLKKGEKQRVSMKRQSHQSHQLREKEKNSTSLSSPPYFEYNNFNTKHSSKATLTNDAYHSIASILLESDGESLHLSEACLSPMSNDFNSLTSTSSLSSASLSPSPSSSSSSTHSRNSLELKLVLETEQHQPPSLSCISPLETLDTFNPFSDLLYTELSDFYLS